MITIIPGFQMELNDSAIIEILKTEGILEKWDSIKLEKAARFMVYDPMDKNERWLIQECLLPGDEGFVLTIINFKVITHPAVVSFLRSLEQMNGFTLNSKVWPLGSHTKETRN
jgi:hypothetical protein